MSAPLIRFGDDGSLHADRAWLWIGNQCWPGWDVEAVRADPPKFDAVVAPEREALHPWNPPTPRLAPAASQVRSVVHLRAENDPRLTLSEPSAASLLVIGPKGHAALGALHLGSTAEFLLRQPPAPLLLAKSVATVRRVLVCNDGSDDALAAVRAFAALPWSAGCHVDLLWVGDPDDTPDATVSGLLHAAGVDMDVQVRQGRTTTVLEDILDRNEHELVVLGTRGRSGLRALPFAVGSTANAVVRIARCSVLVARRTS